MKFTLSWLKDHLATDASLEQIAAQLSALGLVVDSILNRGADLDGFCVAEIKAVRRHEGSDRLNICTVWTGHGTVDVVCGGVNVRPHMKVVFARSGLRIPSTGLVLKEAVIRGVPSSGMLCSKTELNLGEDAPGAIMDLPEDAPVGAPFADYWGLNDPVFDVEITPNRGDCLGVRGIARDLAASELGTLKPLMIQAVAGTFDTPIHIRQGAGGKDLCAFFAGRTVRGVRGDVPSPLWMSRRLEAIGIRPISALVDVTNYLAVDLGRPMHAFDQDRLVGGTLTVAPCEGDIAFEGLDDKTYSLKKGMLVVQDGSTAPAAIAGIMGGKGSACTEDTTTIFLESAVFDKGSIAQTGRMLGIHSDARARFERGVDPDLVLPALHYGAALIVAACGGEVGSIVQMGGPEQTRRVIDFSCSHIHQLGGVHVPEERVVAILTALGFTLEADQSAEKGRFHVTVPRWRHDVTGSVDLVEEVLRVHGYDRVDPVPMPSMGILRTPHEGQDVQRRYTWALAARRLCAARGYLETLTWSFLSVDRATLFGGGDVSMAIHNPISQDLSHMRPSLLPNLMDGAARNYARGLDRLRLFEVGHTYHGAPSGERIQQMVIAGVAYGPFHDRHWRTSKPRAVDPYDMKGDVLALLGDLGVPISSLQIKTDTVPPHYHPGRSGILCLDPKRILGAFGEVHPAIIKKMDMPVSMVAFEIFVDHLPVPNRGGSRPFHVSPYQPVRRDFAFLMDVDQPVGRLIQAVLKADRSLITDVSIFDVYEGPHVPQGTKSVALSVRIEPQTQTLTDHDLTALFHKITTSATSVGAHLRTGDETPCPN